MTKLVTNATAVMILFAAANDMAAATTLRGPRMNQDMARELASANSRLLKQCDAVLTPENAADLPVHITSLGTDGPTVFLVHGGVQGGLGGGPESFVGQKVLSKEGWKLELIDRPGFGRSPSRGVDDMDADAALIADKFGENVNLVGHSFGGAEALLAAARRPEAVRSLILVEPALHSMLATDTESASKPEVRSSIQMVAQLTLDAQSPAAFATSFSRTLGPSNPSEAALREHPEGARALGCALLRARRASPEAMRSAADIVVRNRIPVLIISGGYSARQDETDRILAKLLHGRHIIVESPNHFIQQTRPDEFNDVIVAFMRKVDQRGHGS